MTCCNHDCGQGRDCHLRAAKVAPIGKQRRREDLKTTNGGACVDTELPTPTAPINHIHDGLKLFAYLVCFGLVAIAAAVAGIALSSVF
jgi:hypothetical protein